VTAAAVNSAASAADIAQPWQGAAIVQATMTEGIGPLWPGAITTDHGADDAWEDHSVVPPDVVGGRPGTPSSQRPNDLAGNLPSPVPGEGYVPSGVAWLDHDVANPYWDSDAGNYWGPGGVSDIHNLGRGSSPKFFETPQDIGHPADLYIPSQSYAPEWSWDSVTGNRDNLATQWIAHDQVPDWNGSGYDYTPRQYDYEINIVTPNLAQVSQPTIDEGQYGVWGQQSDYSNHWDDQSVLYAPPPDPQVNQSALVTAPYSSYESEDW
jgi:hypothetical protein